MQGRDGDKLADEITRDAWRRWGMTPAEVWSMPTHHFAFVFFEPPERSTDDRDAMQEVRDINAARAKPYLPNWLLSEYRITSRRL